MPAKLNKGFDPATILEYKNRLKTVGRNFLFDDDDEQTDEYVHFYFIGKYEGKEVIYDAVMYTLRLQHESELFEIAEHRAAQHFPQYKKITYEEDDNGNLEALNNEEEEIGLFIAEVIMELEEEGHIKVSEHVDYDLHADFGIGLDVGLHIESVTPKDIEKFVKDFNDDKLKLDTTLYSFQTQDEQASS
ncbi:MAG: hypothetical protein L0Y35_06260 [Flammeovirgaceae bacterium]|nr:hypothetical protein [Flammeovirgaceae bacterium]